MRVLLVLTPPQRLSFWPVGQATNLRRQTLGLVLVSQLTSIKHLPRSTVEDEHLLVARYTLHNDTK